MMCLWKLASMNARDPSFLSFFFFQAEDGIRDVAVTGVQTCALPISLRSRCAHISIEGHSATVRGPSALSGTVVQASDLRASAGLVLAGLVANGETMIERGYHIDRGYEGVVEELQRVGADIERVHGPVS